MISRSQGRSSVGASAYRSGEKIVNENDGVIHNYTKKTGVEYSEIMTPENAPENFNNRSELWNAVEKSEKRINSQTAREVTIALPKELSLDENIKMVQEFTKDNFVDNGMCADINIHNKNDGNPHAHIMLTTREVNAQGFTNKNRDWNNKQLLNDWRSNWADTQNKYLEKNNIQERVNHLSYEKQGVEKIPTKHLGVIVNSQEKKGITTERGNYNRAIEKLNKSYEQLENDIKVLKTEYEKISQENIINNLEPETKRNVNEIKMDYMDNQNKINDMNLKRTAIYEKLEINKKFIKNHNTSVQEINNAKENISSIDNKIQILERQKSEIKGFFKSKDKQLIDDKIAVYQKNKLTLNAQIENTYKKLASDEKLEIAVNNINKLNTGLDNIKLDIQELNNKSNDLKFEYKYQTVVNRLENKQVEEIPLKFETMSIREKLKNNSMKNEFNQVTNKDKDKILAKLPDNLKDKFNKELKENEIKRAKDFDIDR